MSVRAFPAQEHVSSDGTKIAHGAGGFQVLADGTQDLAALVGLFATESVERYTADYTRGFLPPVAAPLSLLGLLGFVRALLKLALGVEFCERVGFSIVPLRPFQGVRDRDITHNENIVVVEYLERIVSGTLVQWKCTKSVQHTPESMPLTAGDGVRNLRDRNSQGSSYGIAMCSLNRHKGTAALATILNSIGLVVSASLASFPILISTSRWTWSRYFACVGLTASVLLGGLPWCLVYLIEHLPFENTGWFRYDWIAGRTTDLSADGIGRSPQRKNTLAFFARENQFYIFDCRAVSRLYCLLARAASFCAAVSLTVAYICQYIELRVASSKISGIWLGVQGFLAILRIVAWNWAPRVPGLGSFDFAETVIRWTDQRNYCFRNSLTELEITLCWATASVDSTAWKLNDQHLGRQECENRPQAPQMPVWLVENLDGLRLTDAFRLGNCLRSGNRGVDLFHVFRNSSSYWDMPAYVFARWLKLRCRDYGHEIRHDGTQRRLGVGNWVCRIIQDIDGGLHIIPGVSLLVYPPDQSIPPTEIVYFTWRGDVGSDILSFPTRDSGPGTQALYQRMTDIPNDGRKMPHVAKLAQEMSYREVAESLWAELLGALKVMGLSDNKTDMKYQY